jgi:hypothetical protein
MSLQHSNRYEAPLILMVTLNVIGELEAALFQTQRNLRTSNQRTHCDKYTSSEQLQELMSPSVLTLLQNQIG